MEGVMSKKFIVFLIGVLLIAGALSWLISLDNKKETEQVAAPQVTIAVQTVETAQPEADQSEATPVPLTPLSNAQLNQYQSAAQQAMRCYKDIYLGADKGSASNVVLSDGTVAQIVGALGANGYSAIDYFCNLNMQNAQTLIDFGNMVNAGMDAEACYYVVHSDGSLHANNLSYKDGVASVVTVSAEWDGEKPSVYSTGQFALTDLRLTSKGWLICTRDSEGGGSSWAVNGNAYTFVRLVPYDDTKRQLGEKYLGNMAYAENNLFTCTWSAADYSHLDLNSLFLVLYSRYYGTDPLSNDNMKMITGFNSVPDTNLHVVPYEQYERVISQYIDMSSDTIRWLSDTSSKYGGYLVLGTRHEYYNNRTPKLPAPEVTDYWYNADGSLTMKVDAVFPAYGTDCAFTHELTVKDTKDGYQYISNWVYESESNIIPELVLRGERKNQIAAMKK